MVNESKCPKHKTIVNIICNTIAVCLFFPEILICPQCLALLTFSHLAALRGRLNLQNVNIKYTTSS